ncbi:MAG: hypothetical protein GTO16_04995 [Candidatus Aminicenantes bacterium]|nr:hypothetical protein [Candidatus Aminicenantes bacterium]
MDRRSFFRRILYAPLLTPFILNAKSSQTGFQFYVLADSPQVFLPTILQELQKCGMIQSHSFTLLNLHPEEKELKRTLSEQGWRLVPRLSQPDLALSFRHLRNRAIPSFTFIKGGKVRDLRSRKLRTLWKEMNNHSPSCWLTIAHFNSKGVHPYQGAYASFYIEGQKVGNVSLEKNFFRKFQTERGNINVIVENGKARVSESSCRHKICLLTPPVYLAGERIICVPNHFLLEIQGSHCIDTVIG